MVDGGRSASRGPADLAVGFGLEQDRNMAYNASVKPLTTSGYTFSKFIEGGFL